MVETKTEASKLSPIMLVIAVLLLTLIGAGAGIAVGSVLGITTAPAKPLPTVNSEVNSKNNETSGSASEETPQPEAEGQIETISVPLPPVLTNLAEPSNAWVRVEGTLLIAKETTESKELLAEKAGDNILAFLRTVKLSQIEGPSGFLNLRQDLNDTVATLSAGQVREILIRSLVVE